MRLIDATGIRSFDVRDEVGQRIERPLGARSMTLYHFDPDAVEP